MSGMQSEVDHPLQGSGSNAGSNSGSGNGSASSPSPASTASQASNNRSTNNDKELVEAQNVQPALDEQPELIDSDSDDERDPRHERNPFAQLAAAASASASSSSPSTISAARAHAIRRARDFWRALRSSGRIDESIVRRYVFESGCPEQPGGMRALLWKLLLGYLPWDRSQWDSQLNKQRQTYQQFVQELTSNPFADMEKGESNSSDNNNSSGGVKRNLQLQKLNAGDDPLSITKTDNTWSKYYKDNSIREEIDKDVRRTYSSFHFFNERVRPVETTTEEVKRMNAAEREKLAREQQQQSSFDSYSSSSSSSSSSSRNLFASSPNGNLFDSSLLTKHSMLKNTSVQPVTKVEVVPMHVGRKPDDERHHDVLKRILFIFAKLNPGIRYVQGMNEILAPIYFVFASRSATDLKLPPPLEAEVGTGDDDDGTQPLESASALFGVGTAEADSFFCFSTIMSHLRDRFIKSLDLSPTGVLHSIAHLNNLVRRMDYAVHQHLQQLGVDPRFYSFRWLTLLLSQEFELPDVLRLWDSLFAAEAEAEEQHGEPTPQQLAAARRRQQHHASNEDDSQRKKLIVEFLNDCCCAILMLIRRRLLEADFSIALKLLQSAGQGLDVQRVLNKAMEIKAIRQAGGGYVPGQTKPPPPRTPKEEAMQFTTPSPAPGEATTHKKKQKTVAIAMQNAQPTVIHSAASPTSASSPSPSPVPSPASTPSPSHHSGALPGVLSTSVSSALSVASDSAASLAGGVAALALAAQPIASSALASAEAGAHVVSHAVMAATDMAANVVRSRTQSTADKESSENGGGDDASTNAQHS